MNWIYLVQSSHILFDRFNSYVEPITTPYILPLTQMALTGNIIWTGFIWFNPVIFSFTGLTPMWNQSLPPTSYLLHRWRWQVPVTWYELDLSGSIQFHSIWPVLLLCGTNHYPLHPTSCTNSVDRYMIWTGFIWFNPVIFYLTGSTPVLNLSLTPTYFLLHRWRL
jgi:hypothetical protein